MPSISKDTFNTLLPPGPLGLPKAGGDLDLLLDGMSANADVVADFLSDLAHIRNPKKTPIFEDLEREYGIRPNENVLMSVRIMRLARKVYQGQKIDSPDDLQDALDAAGFDLQVHLNDPPVDPSLFLTQAFKMVSGGDNAFAGFEPLSGPPSTAFAGSLGGELVVNGDIFLKTNAIEMQAGGDFAFSGYFDVVTVPQTYKSTAGFFSSINQDKLDFRIPSPEFWNMVFFVGGAATRDPVTDELTVIEQGFVDANRRNDLVTTILEIKPLMAWCGLITTFT